MRDVSAAGTKDVWGFKVPVNSYRRHQWPAGLRAAVVARVAEGARIRETAEEIGANKSLVAKWVKDAERSDDGPAFVEVIPLEGQSGYSHSCAPPDKLSFTIRINDVELTIGPGYPAAPLTEILRAVRVSG